MSTQNPEYRKARPALTIAGRSRRHVCSQPVARPRAFSRDVHPNRAAAILAHDKKWVNGTNLTYAFLGGPSAQKAAMRTAFKTWKNVGIGLTFTEVTDPDDAKIRIAFEDDGSWSYIGRDILTIPADESTMNIGWDITTDIDTGVHEIGHTLGLPHEHQNPNAGIVWDDEAVYRSLAAPPNRWSRQKTFDNIIRKLDPSEVRGSNWDPDSIMHYPFEAGLILQPQKYRTGLNPAGGLSALDKQWVRTFYPGGTTAMPALIADQLTPLKVAAGKQANFSIKVDRTADYDIRTFGNTDCVMVLFEEDGKQLKYLKGDDDSATAENAHIAYKLRKSRRYVLRIRMMYVEPGTKSSILLW